jgi:hypothetical protein
LRRSNLRIEPGLDVVAEHQVGTAATGS